MKKLLSIATAAFLGLGLLTPSAHAATPAKNTNANASITNNTSTYYVNATTLNVRSGAGTNYSVIGKLKNGQTISATNEVNGWLQFNYNGKTAYISKQYVSTSVVKAASEFYVTATAYTPYEESNPITAAGYNIRKNPNMKLIAVDPKIIPLGKKVWVEGYGEAIAGDTGGAIKGYRIDVLLPSNKQADQWGRKQVKVRVLN